MHLGRNIARLRMFKGIKQEEIARQLKMTQQNYSHIENSEEIGDEMLGKIAGLIGYDVEYIKEMPEVPYVHSNNQQGGNVINYQLTPVEKIVELYERMLQEERTKNQKLEQLVNELQEKLGRK